MEANVFDLRDALWSDVLTQILRTLITKSFNYSENINLFFTWVLFYFGLLAQHYRIFMYFQPWQKHILQKYWFNSLVCFAWYCRACFVFFCSVCKCGGQSTTQRRWTVHTSNPSRPPFAEQKQRGLVHTDICKIPPNSYLFLVQMDVCTSNTSLCVPPHIFVIDKILETLATIFIIIYQAKCAKISWIQLVKCEDLLL